MEPNDSLDVVYWINSGELRGPKEKFMRWWYEQIMERGTYTPRRVREQPFETKLPVDQIDTIAVESLRRALHHQHEARLTGGPFPIPVASIDGSDYVHTISVARRSPSQ